MNRIQPTVSYVVAPERLEELLDFLARATLEPLQCAPGLGSANLCVNFERRQVATLMQSDGPWRAGGKLATFRRKILIQT
jgi:hypothetical protein